MKRTPGYGKIGVGVLLQNAVPFPMQGYAGGHIHVPDTETPVTLTFYVADSDNDDAVYRPAKTSGGAAIALPAAAGDAIEIHPSLFAALRIKVLAQAVSVGTFFNYPITLKS